MHVELVDGGDLGGVGIAQEEGEGEEEMSIALRQDIRGIPVLSARGFTIAEACSVPDKDLQVLAWTADGGVKGLLAATKK